MRFGARLHVFVEERGLGYVEVEVRYRTSEDDTNTRQPDLAVEVKSPDHTFIKLHEKAIYYLKNGTRLVLLFFPDRKQIEVHTSHHPVKTLGLDYILDGAGVIPGFTMAVSDIFPK
ncbi:MAG: Uma2 family endonuclease [bacterium]|nr:Uma2 family endonuclease [bacterium]